MSIPEFDENDIKLVMNQAMITREKAIEALIKYESPIDAIMQLTDDI